MRPTRLMFVVLLGGVPAVLPAILGWQASWPLALAFWVALALTALADAAACPGPKGIDWTLDTPPTVYLAECASAALRLTFPRGGRRARLRALLDCSKRLRRPPAIERRATDGRIELELPLQPLRRGTATVDRLWLEWDSPLRLWVRRSVTKLDRTIHVLPDLPRVKATALRFFADRSFRTGLKIERYRGDGTEFESLKEFVHGDDQRAIDWKASARHRMLLTRNFRAERNHQVVLAVDSGYLMCEPVDGLAKLDHALNASLLLAWVCLASGDRVGLFSFDSGIGPGLAPLGGVRSMPALIAATSGIDYSTAETNYTLGLTTLAQRLRRRSLIILLTDFVDTVTAELMLENVDRIVRRHVVLFVSIRDPLLGRIERDAPSDVDRLNRALIADSFLQEREVVHRRLQRLGVHTLDAVPQRIGPTLINRYLEIKRRELV